MNQESEMIIMNTESVKTAVAEKKEKKDKILFSLSLLLTFLLPVFFVPFIGLPIAFSKSILVIGFVLLMSVLWIMYRLGDKEFSFSKNPVMVAPVALVAVYVVSAVFSGSFIKSFVGSGFEIGATISVLVSLALMFLTMSAVRTKERAYSVFSSLFVSFIILSIFQLTKIFAPSLLNIEDLATSSVNLIGKWNELAIFYGLIAVLSLVTLTVAQKKLAKILTFIALMVSLFFVALVNFGFVWIVLGVFSFVLSLLVFYFGDVKKGNNFFSAKNIWMPLVVVLASVIFIFGGNNVGNALTSYFKIESMEVRPSLTGTFDVIKGTIAGPRVLLGAGPNMFDNQWIKYKPAGINETVFWSSDFNTGVSFIATSIVNVGIVGFLLWCVLFTSLFYFGYKAVFATINKDKNSGYLLLLSYVSVVYLWLSLIFYIPTVTIFALTFILTGVFISLLVMDGFISVKKKMFTEDHGAGFAFVFGLSFALLILVIGGYMLSQKLLAGVYYQKSLSDFGYGKDINSIESRLLKASDISRDDSFFRLLSEVGLINMQTLLKDGDINDEEVQGQFKLLMDGSIRYAQEAININPENYQNWLSLGKIYEAVASLGVQGATEEAVKSYMSAANLNQTNPVIFFSIGALQYSRQDYNEAMLSLEKAVILRPSYSDAKYLLGLTYYKLGRTNDALIQFDGVRVLNPENQEIVRMIYNINNGLELFSE